MWRFVEILTKFVKMLLRFCSITIANLKFSCPKKTDRESLLLTVGIARGEGSLADVRQDVGQRWMHVNLAVQVTLHVLLTGCRAAHF